MTTRRISDRLIAGAVAGSVATVALQQLRAATAHTFPSTTPPVREEPGEFMVRQLERRLPSSVRDVMSPKVERAAATSLALGYGVTFAALYALLRSRPANVMAEGAVLGVATWAAGYLGWLSATRLMPPVSRQRPRQVITPLVQHVAYGIAAVATVVAVDVVRGAVAGGLPD